MATTLQWLIPWPQARWVPGQTQKQMRLEWRNNKCSWLEHLLADGFTLSSKHGLFTATADTSGIDRKHQSDDGKAVDKWIADHWIGFDWIQERCPV